MPMLLVSLLKAKDPNASFADVVVAYKVDAEPYPVVPAAYSFTDAPVTGWLPPWI